MEHRNDYRSCFIDNCDEKLTNEDLNDRGNQFALVYYESEYYNDYSTVFGDHFETIYHVDESWENYEKLKPVLDQRFSEWLAKSSTSS